jgi:hypothetical protein
VEIRERAIPGQDCVITDAVKEVTLYIGEGALTQETEIRVEELVSVDLPRVSTHELRSPVYHFGPAGTKFAQPVSLSLRLVLPEGSQYHNLVMAGSSDNGASWYNLPTIVDVEKGLVTAQVEHFSQFAVFERVADPVEFSDLDPVRYFWAKPQISYLATREIVRGVGDGSFEPARAVNRGEFVTMLAKALGLEPLSGKTPFTDVQEYAWYAPYLRSALKEKLVSGMSGDVFVPSGVISREQMAVMLANSLAGAEKRHSASSFGDSADISPWAVEAVNVAVDQGLLQGFPDGSFRPQEPVTRAQSAAAIYRLMIMK